MPKTTTVSSEILDITVDKHEVDLMLNAAEQTLMGTSLRLYLDRNMAPYMRKRAAARFASEGFGTWEPLSEATIAIREAKGFPGAHPINRRTGNLENFMTRGRLDFTMQANAASMFFPGTPPGGELKAKVRTAQMGKESPKTVPRPVAVATVIDMAYFVNDFSFWFRRQMEAKFHGTGGSV